MGAKFRPSSRSNSQSRRGRGSVRFPLGHGGRKEEENCRTVQGFSRVGDVPHQNTIRGSSLERRGFGASCLRLLLPGLEDRGALAIHLPLPSRSLLQKARRRKLPSRELRQSALIDFKRLNPACLPPQRGRAFWARVPVPLIDLKRLMQVYLDTWISRYKWAACDTLLLLVTVKRTLGIPGTYRCSFSNLSSSSRHHRVRFSAEKISPDVCHSNPMQPYYLYGHAWLASELR